jgi:hypothetical protein
MESRRSRVDFSKLSPLSDSNSLHADDSPCEFVFFLSSNSSLRTRLEFLELAPLIDSESLDKARFNVQDAYVKP